MPKRFFCAALAAALLLCLILPAFGAETQAAAGETPVQVYTVQDLMDMEKDPEGSYILMADLDMTDVRWKPLDFSGKFDGNGHALLNLTLTQPADASVKLADEDENLYDSAAFGFFGTLRGAQVENLSLINVRCRIQWEGECALGALAGYSQDSTITDCLVSGALELRAGGWVSCLGGLVGFGSGTIRRCSVSTTLIDVDTNAQSMGEEYFGGVFGAGFFDVYESNVVLEGYISQHGYVHSGGIAGMFAEFPLAVGRKGYIKDNTVTGQITFFEDNDDRLALCRGLLGMTKVNRYYLDGNTEDFKSTEVKDYDRELRPEECAEPVYSVRVVEPGCSRYGFTQFTCDGCGYSYRDRYTCFAHTVFQWEVTKAPTQDAEGESRGQCECGLQFVRTEPKLAPVAETAATQPRETEIPEPTAAEPQQELREKTFDIVFYAALGLMLVLILSGSLVIRALIRRKRKNP